MLMSYVHPSPPPHSPNVHHRTSEQVVDEQKSLHSNDLTSKYGMHIPHHCFMAVSEDMTSNGDDDDVIIHSPFFRRIVLWS